MKKPDFNLWVLETLPVGKLSASSYEVKVEFNEQMLWFKFWGVKNFNQF